MLCFREQKWMSVSMAQSKNLIEWKLTKINQGKYMFIFLTLNFLGHLESSPNFRKITILKINYCNSGEPASCHSAYQRAPQNPSVQNKQNPSCHCSKVLINAFGKKNLINAIACWNYYIYLTSSNFSTSSIWNARSDISWNQYLFYREKASVLSLPCNRWS